MCFFFKQKTASEMRISDWSSDVCSSDLAARDADAEQHRAERQVVAERKPLREQFHHLPSPPASSAGVGASGECRLASIFTMRKRSPARTLACALGTWCLVPSRLRRVKIGRAHV